jgi:hypothetical protein
MAEESLERELQCAVSAMYKAGIFEASKLTSWADMHRHPLPATYSFGLSTHVLRLLSERVVHMASNVCSEQQADCSALYLPIMSGFSQRNEGGLAGEHTAGGILEGEPG